MAVIAGKIQQDPNDPGYQGGSDQLWQPAFTAAGLAAGGTATPGGLGAGPNGRFVNFANFMNANQGAAQGMDQSLASDISKQGDQAAKDVQGVQTQFGIDVGNGATTPQYQTLPSVGAYDPGKIGYTTQSYAGPTSMAQDPNAGYGAAQAEANDAGAAANATGSQGGLASLFQSKYGNSGYTGGMNAMDAALGGAYGGSTFGDLRNKYGGLSNVLNQENANSGQYVQNRQNQLAQQNQAAYDRAYASQQAGVDYNRKKNAKQIADEGTANYGGAYG